MDRSSIKNDENINIKYQPKTMRNQPEKILMALGFIALLIPGFSFYQDYQDTISHNHWVNGVGTVSMSYSGISEEPHFIAEYDALIVYDYAVNGTTYEGTCCKNLIDYNPSYADSIAKNYPRGAKIKLLVNPDNPRDSFLLIATTHVDPDVYAWIILSLFTGGVGVYAYLTRKTIGKTNSKRINEDVNTKQ